MCAFLLIGYSKIFILSKMSVKYEDKDIINSVKLAAYEYAYKNLRSGPSVVHLSSLSELLKIFFPAAQIVIKYDVDTSCFGSGEKTIEKIKIISGQDVKNFEYDYLNIKKFIENILGISCSKLL